MVHADVTPVTGWSWRDIADLRGRMAGPTVVGEIHRLRLLTEEGLPWVVEIR